MIGGSPGMTNHPYHNNVWGVPVKPLGHEY